MVSYTQRRAELTAYSGEELRRFAKDQYGVEVTENQSLLAILRHEVGANLIAKPEPIDLVLEKLDQIIDLLGPGNQGQGELPKFEAIEEQESDKPSMVLYRGYELDELVESNDLASLRKIAGDVGVHPSLVQRGGCKALAEAVRSQLRKQGKIG